MGKILDLVAIAKEVEKFWFSGENISFIPVSYNPPINQIYNFKVLRESTYLDSLRSVLANICLHLSIMRRIRTSGYTSDNIVVGAGPTHTKLQLEAVNNFAYRAHLMGNISIGNFPVNV